MDGTIIIINARGIETGSYNTVATLKNIMGTMKVITGHCSRIKVELKASTLNYIYKSSL